MFDYAKHDTKDKTTSTHVPKIKAHENEALRSTGIPSEIRNKFERLSGFSFSDVQVHYNSDKPKMLGALAYTQGNQVFISSGQEKHLEHELGHVVQQKRGSVKPTLRIGGLELNISDTAEKEADQIAYGGATSMEPAHSNFGELPTVNCNIMQMQFPEQDIQKLRALLRTLQQTFIHNYIHLTNIIYDALTTKVSEEYSMSSVLPPLPEDEDIVTLKQNTKILEADYEHYESSQLEQNTLNGRFIVNVDDQISTSILVSSLINLMNNEVNKKNMKFKAFFGKTAARAPLKYDKIIVYYNCQVEGLDNKIQEALNKPGVMYNNELSAFYKPMDNPSVGWGVDEDPHISFSQIRTNMVAKAYIEFSKLPEEIRTEDDFIRIVEDTFRKDGYSPEKPWRGRTIPSSVVATSSGS